MSSQSLHGLEIDLQGSRGQSEQELRDYFTYLVEKKQVPSSTLRTEIFGVKFLFDKTLQRPWPTLRFLRARPRTKLPVVLDREEALRLVRVVYGIYAPDQDNDNDVTAVLNPDNTTTISGSWSALDGNPVSNINTFGPGLLAAGLGDVDFYFNMHTAGNSGGEIRGQVVGIPEPSAGVLSILALAASLA